MANVMKLVNVPVLVTTLPEHLDAQWLFDAYARNIELSHASSQPLYWVIDVRAAETTYVSDVSAWCQIARGLSGASIAPELKMAFVAEPGMMAFFNGEGLTAFNTVEEAVAFALHEMMEPAVGV